VDGDAVFGNLRGDDELLGLGVGGQLGGVDDHRPGHRRRAPAPQGQQTLLLGDPGEGVEDAGVAPPLFGRKPAVRRHPDEGNLGRRPHEGADPAGRHPDGRLRQEVGRRGSVFSRHLEKRLVNAHPGRRVRGLAQEARRESVVHAEEAFGLDDVGDGVKTGFVGLGPTGLPAHLHPVFDQIQGLDEQRGAHPRRSAEQKLDGIGDGRRRGGRC